MYHGLRAVGNSIPYERYRLQRWYEVLVPGLPPRLNIFCACFVFQDIQNMNIRQKEIVFNLTHAITILSLFKYSVCDEKVKTAPKDIILARVNASYFLVTYGVCKKRKYCNRMSEIKKNSLLLTNVHDFYILQDKTSQIKFPSVCLSVCLSGCLDVRTYVDFSCGHNNF